jgi:tripartite ATP-independent transporter DctM subunit
MTAQATLAVAPTQAAPERPRLFGRVIRVAENSLLSVALGLMIVLPLAEIVMRRTMHVGVTGATSIVQHLGLIVGMIGGMIAARERRLLALSTIGDTLLKGKAKSIGRIFSGAVGAAITAYLAIASYQFVLTEREAGGTLVYGISIWIVEMVLPLGFVFISLRLISRIEEKWWARGIALALAIALGTLAYYAKPDQALYPALALLGFATLIGTPAFVTLGGAALILFWAVDQPIASIPVAHYSLVTNPSLPTIPLFTAAGYFLAEGGAPRRFIRVFDALFGRMAGGPAIVTVLVCAFFTSFTGASGVTILALGGLLMPVLLSARYTEKNALGLLTASGSLGLLLPPCLPLILYAIVARIPIQQIFLGGIGPAILLVVATGLWGMLSRGRATATAPFSWTEARQALWEAKWELLVPIVALVALFAGIATPVEAAALTALYAFVVEVIVYRDLKLFGDVPRVMAECGLLVGGVLLILGVALGFTNYLVDVQIPARAVEWTTSAVHSRFVFLLLLNLFLLVVGCLMDIYSAIVVQVPLLVPLGVAYGIDPVHLGIIFLANLELGYLTPPVGLNLFLSSYRFGKPIPQVLRATLPYIFVLGAGVLLITYVPALTTSLPRWFGQ